MVDLLGAGHHVSTLSSYDRIMLEFFLSSQKKNGIFVDVIPLPNCGPL